MSSLLRLPTLDRPNLGLSKRFSLMSAITGSSTREHLATDVQLFGKLPTVECFDDDDFLNMFATSSGKKVENIAIPAPQNRDPVPELSATPTMSRFPELHNTPIQRFELAQFPRSPPPVNQKESTFGDSLPAFGSSVSSSNPSTKRSNASSRRTRRSSLSSVTDELSSSERSSKESDMESVAQKRSKRSSKGRKEGVDDITITSKNDSRLGDTKAVSDTNLPINSSFSSSRQISSHTPTGSVSSNTRPASRGSRLGRAMSEGVTKSAPQTPKRISDLNEGSPPKNTVRSTASDSSTSASNVKRIPSFTKVDDVDRIRVGIMSHLDHVNDLQACAQISKDFYDAFQKHETYLVGCVLYQQSPAAWELRYSVRHLEKPSPFRLRSVQRDHATIQALQDFVVWRCRSILRPNTLKAFLGDNLLRKLEIEDAIWKIWTFCNIFGKTSMSDASLQKQTQWLNGISKRPNRSTKAIDSTNVACTMKQLEDMSEMWRCFEVLLSGFRGREQEARLAGLFDRVGDVKASDRKLLNYWIHDVLSLGPKAVLTLSSCDFEQARVLGITMWSPPVKGRTGFLKAAVEEVYRERLMTQARQKALDYRRSVQDSHKSNSSDSPRHSPTLMQASLSSQATQQSSNTDERKISRPSMLLGSLPPLHEQLEIRPDCDPLSPIKSTHTPMLSPGSNPTVFSPLSMAKNASARMGPTLFPIQNRDQSQRLSVPLALLDTDHDNFASQHRADVIDPTDKAVALMVQEMGFSEADAKRALAKSDTGSGISVQRAIDLLSADSTMSSRQKQFQLCELPADIDDATLTRRLSKQDLCEGHCRSVLLVEPRRDRVSGLGIVKRGLSYRMSFRKGPARLTSISDEEGRSMTGYRNTKFSTTSRASTLTQLASSAISAFTSPVLSQAASSGSLQQHDSWRALPPASPVSPITPATDWLGPDTNPIAEARANLEGRNQSALVSTKPRITLQRVGTGVKNTGWNMPGRKKKDHIIEPEVIGYAY